MNWFVWCKSKNWVRIHREFNLFPFLCCTTQDLQTMARCEVTLTSCLCLCMYGMLVCSMHGYKAHSISPSPADVCCQGMVCVVVLSRLCFQFNFVSCQTVLAAHTWHRNAGRDKMITRDWSTMPPFVRIIWKLHIKWYVWILFNTLPTMFTGKCNFLLFCSTSNLHKVSVFY